VKEGRSNKDFKNKYFFIKHSSYENSYKDFPIIIKYILRFAVYYIVAKCKDKTICNVQKSTITFWTFICVSYIIFDFYIIEN